MAISMYQLAIVCGSLLWLAGLLSTAGLQSGTLVLTEGGNSVDNATLLVVSQPSPHLRRRMRHHFTEGGGRRRTLHVSIQRHETCEVTPRRCTRRREVPSGRSIRLPACLASTWLRRYPSAAPYPLFGLSPHCTPTLESSTILCGRSCTSRRGGTHAPVMHLCRLSH
jgi:hypothetical protein